MTATPPFRLLHLPSVAFQNVFQQFNTFEVLMFSLCSKATKRLSKLFMSEKPTMFNLTLTKDGGATLLFQHCKFTENRETMMQDYEYMLTEDIVKIPYNKNISIVRCVKRIPDVWMRSGDKANRSQIAEYEIAWKRVDEELKNWIKNVSDVFDVSIGILRWHADNEDMCQWFLEEPSIKIGKINFYTEPSPELALRQMNGTLMLYPSRRFTLPHLLTASEEFHKIELIDSPLSDQELNTFIKEWIGGNSDMKKLEYLTVERSTRALKMLERQIIDGITVERYEEYEDRVFVPPICGPGITSDANFPSYIVFRPSTPGDKFSFEFGLDIKSNDGKKATIYMEHTLEGKRRFQFLVWK